MVLLYAALFGIIAGVWRARIGGQQYALSPFRSLWLAPVAFLPQLVVFYTPVLRRSVPDDITAVALVSSQFLLLLFVWLNRHSFGMWMLGVGLALNLTVIVANGGLMPLSPQTMTCVAPGIDVSRYEFGHRVGATKDVLLRTEETRLALLSDILVPPAWFPQRVAFSVGDIWIAAGIFVILWHGGCRRNV